LDGQQILTHGGRSTRYEAGQGGIPTMSKDAFDQWWEWADKPTDSPLTITAKIHDAVMMLTPEERKDRAIVNETVRSQATPWRPAGSADEFGAPVAEE
jgi:hypothetical protein